MADFSSKQFKIWSLSILLLAAAALGFHFLKQANAPQVIHPQETSARPSLPGQQNRNSTTPPDLQKVAQLCTQLQKTQEALNLLTNLKKKLTKLPPDQAITLITKFLRSGIDAKLPLSFKLAPDGSLQTPPTLRTALLDFIFLIDPATAADLSHEILQIPTQADEWALALRNLARHKNTPETNELLIQKTLDLINNPQWQQEPSTGYLEAFDLLVYTRATRTTPLLSNLIQKPDRQDLRHAAFLTLDRLAQTDITAVLNHLLEDHHLAKAYPKMVAQQFARADLKIPEQKKLIDQWLRHPARTELQIETFQASYPNQNSIISPGLVSSARN